MYSRICLRNCSTSHACLLAVYRAVAACLGRRMVHKVVGRMRIQPMESACLQAEGHAETSWIR